jgi:hypothetical protein
LKCNTHECVSEGTAVGDVRKFAATDCTMQFTSNFDDAYLVSYITQYGVIYGEMLTLRVFVEHIA